jgi:signal transduction histidine kinase
MPQISPTSFEDSLVDALPLPACICEAPSGVIIRSNAQAVALWGQHPEPDTRIHDVLHFIRADGVPLPPDAFPLAAAIADGTADANRQAVIERRGQPSVLVRINILPLNTVGQRRAGLMLFHSASERRLGRETQLKRKGPDAPNDWMIGERMYADTGTAARDLLADVSHELRSLLGGLAVSAALLIADAPSGEEGDKIRKHAGASRRTVAGMTRLINDLLDTASIEAGRLSIILKPVDVGKLVSDTIEAVRSIAAAKNITLKAALPVPSLSATLDDLRILQVLENLVGNAIKFTPEGGKVSIGVRTTARRIQFVVSDTGVGIPLNKLDAIFERFHQVSKDRRGFGLGLHISKSIVEAHGGRIWAESDGASGSTFYVDLPVAPVRG